MPFALVLERQSKWPSRAMYRYTYLRVKGAKRWLDGSKMTRSGFLQVFGTNALANASLFVSMKP